MVGEHVDISSEPDPRARRDGGTGSRRFLGIHFACCDVYSRIYVNRQGTAYEGYCPKCSRPIRVAIGPGGTDQRFFTAY